MRRIIKLSVACAAAGALGACTPDTVTETAAVPTAGIRFINAVPDTGAMDFRFVDIVENSSHWNIGYRNNPSTTAGETNSLGVQFKNAQAGSQRHFKIFFNSTNPAIASIVIKDTTVDLVAGHNYTVLLWGYMNPTGAGRPANAAAMRLNVIDETVAVPAGQVALRVVNATSDLTVDASYFAANAAPPGTSIATGVAPMSISNYVNAPPADTLQPYRVLIQPAGGGGVVYANQIAMKGAWPQISGTACNPASQKCDLEGLPGTTQAGSAVTAFIFPPAVSTAPTLTITTGGTPQRATLTGYAAPRDYAADGFFVGQEINVTGFTNAANNGPAQITAVLPRRTTGSVSLSATATGYARATGSFITNGIQVGDEITASGFATAANNGRSVVIAVTATTIDVTKTSGTAVEAAATGRTLITDGELQVNKATIVEPFPTSNRTIAGLRGRLLSFMFDARPARPAGT
ncbi:MAG TPA: DUF4397 domain-containing protein [Gemmatimonadaceae bacterium]|nr:DUF4397 domain-containing protein [Gemmatimonadaceae bacterium]